MNDGVPLGLLFGILVLLLLLSAFFSSTETALMSLNRYRLRHKARSGHRGARMAEALLRRPDRLIGLILLGNNLVNISAASLTTVLALRIGGESAVAAGALVLTVVVLIFSEVAPKTMAALNPERLALPAAYIYMPLLKVLYPVVWFVNFLANGLLRLVGVRPDQIASHSLSSEELKTIVAEAGAMIPTRYQRMLLSVLDLGNMVVDDVMVPRNEIKGIDLDDGWEEIEQAIQASRHSRLPVFRDDIDNIQGVLNIRAVVPDLATGRLDERQLRSRLSDAYFVPEGTSLSRQLLAFQHSGQRLALVVDEYGDVQGLVSVEDILREIVGEFDPGEESSSGLVAKESNQSYLVQANIGVRTLNRLMGWSLPTDGPKTLNGLIIEHLETIPAPGTALQVAGYPIEILETGDNAIRQVRVHAAPRSH